MVPVALRHPVHSFNKLLLFFFYPRERVLLRAIRKSRPMYICEWCARVLGVAALDVRAALERPLERTHSQLLFFARCLVARRFIDCRGRATALEC